MRGVALLWLDRVTALPATPCRHSLHVLAPVCAFGSQTIVSPAQQSQVVWLGTAAFSCGVSVVELEPRPTAAAYAVSIDPAAAEPIALENHAAHGAGDVRA